MKKTLELTNYEFEVLLDILLVAADKTDGQDKLANKAYNAILNQL